MVSAGVTKRYIVACRNCAPRLSVLPTNPRYCKIKHVKGDFVSYGVCTGSGELNDEALHALIANLINLVLVSFAIRHRSKLPD